MKIIYGDRKDYVHLSVTSTAPDAQVSATLHLSAEDGTEYTVENEHDVPAGTDLTVKFDQDGDPCADVLVTTAGQVGVVHAAIESRKGSDTRTGETGAELHVGPAYFAPRADAPKAIRPGTAEYDAFQQFQAGNTLSPDAGKDLPPPPLKQGDERRNPWNHN